MHYGYGISCMYKTDYSSIGGFNTGIQGWGGEDDDIYSRHVQSPLQVLVAGSQREGGKREKGRDGGEMLFRLVYNEYTLD